MNVLLIMETVSTIVIILLVLTTAPAELDINWTLIDTNVEVRTYVCTYVTFCMGRSKQISGISWKVGYKINNMYPGNRYAHNTLIQSNYVCNMECNFTCELYFKHWFQIIVLMYTCDVEVQKCYVCDQIYENQSKSHIWQVALFIINGVL